MSQSKTLNRLRRDVSLQAFHTFGLDVRARYYLPVASEREVVEFLMDNPPPLPYPLLILGGGSNVLFVKDFPGLVLHNQILGKEVVREDNRQVWLRVGAGENWHELVQYAIANDWGGIENLSLIPGTTGAAPIQNIGAYGVELREVFENLAALNLATGQSKTFDATACRFGYRDSIFKREAKGKYLITHVTLRLSKSPHTLNTAYAPVREALADIPRPTIADISRIVTEIRRSKLPDPAEIGNAGSFFKNPVLTQQQFAEIQKKHPDAPHYPQPEGVKVPAAWLIQTAGWKGKRFDTYGVHPRQALVLVNYGGAQGQNIYDLSEQILASVREQFGVELEREVNVIG